MAYISTEKVKEIRDNLKKEFPSIKFSVKRSHYSSVTVSIMKSPLDFSQDITNSGYNYVQLNHYYLDRYSHSDVLKIIKDIAMKGNHNNSDPMTDYFDVGWYFHFNIGQFDKPYQQIK
jgi:hypothetical protein